MSVPIAIKARISLATIIGATIVPLKSASLGRAISKTVKDRESQKTVAQFGQLSRREREREAYLSKWVSLKLVPAARPEDKLTTQRSGRDLAPSAIRKPKGEQKLLKVAFQSTRCEAARSWCPYASKTNETPSCGQPIKVSPVFRFAPFASSQQ